MLLEQKPPGMDINGNNVIWLIKNEEAGYFTSK